MNLSLEDLLFLVPAFVIAIAIHEASHAVVATVLGDSTPRSQGRVTLNPARHLDPLGTLTLFLMGFGWGKPVFVNPGGFRRVGPVAGMAMVAFAGPLSNIILAALFSLPFRLQMVPSAELWRWTLHIGELSVRPVPELFGLLGVVASINLLLAVFNMIPLPPLDGFSVLLGILPAPLANTIAPLGRYGPAALLGLFALSYVFRLNVFGALIDPPYSLLRPIVLGV